MDKEITIIQAEAKNIIITNQEQLTFASSKREEAKKKLKQITEEKDKVLKPLKEAVKAENARWSPMETILEDAIEILNKGMIKYMTDKRNQELEEEKKIMADRRTKVETKIDKLAEVEKVENKVSTDVGSTSFVEVKCFEVEDITKVPKEYLLIDEVKVRASMKAGVEITGIKYWIESRPRSGR